MLNEYVQCVIGYIRFGPFLDMMHEEWNKVLLDKFGSLFCVCDFHEYKYFVVRMLNADW